MAKMTEDDVQRIIAYWLDHSVGERDDGERDFRMLAHDYYEGYPFGDEVDGHSQLVMTPFRDIVEYIMPPLMRIFTSARYPAMFVPSNPQEEKYSDQATHVVSHVVMRQNDGYRLIQDWVKNGLMYRNGIFKWWWEESERTYIEEYTGLDHDAVQAFIMDPEVEITFMETYDADVVSDSPQFHIELDVQEVVSSALSSLAAPLPAAAAPAGAGSSPDDLQSPVNRAPAAAPEGELWIALTEKLFNVEITRTVDESQVMVQCLPPEEFIYEPGAENIEDAAYVAHRQLLTVSDLIERGYNENDIRDLPTEHDRSISSEKQNRHREQDHQMDDHPPDDSMHEKLIYESYVYMDYDGDGVAELRRIVSGDRGKVIFENMPWDEKPFSLASPLVMPNELEGKGIGDLTMDLQLIQSKIMRQALDGLVQQNMPRIIAVEDQVEIEDILDNELGGVIRARAPGMVEPLPVPQIAQQALPFMEYTNDLLERRTGISETSMGLDAEALRTMTATAASGQMSASFGSIELIARNFADGLSAMYEGVLKLLHKHQQKPMTLRLRGEWVAMDPRQWNANLKAESVVGLGSGSEQEKMTALSLIIQKQESLMQQLGPNNPLVDMMKLYNGYAKFSELSGFRNVDQFFNEPTPEAMQAYQQAQANQPDPAEQQMKQVLMIEQMKTQAKIEADKAKAQADFQIDVMKLQAETQLEQQKALLDMRIKYILAQQEMGMETDLKQQELAIEAAFKRMELEMEAELKTNVPFQANIKAPDA